MKSHWRLSINGNNDYVTMKTFRILLTSYVIVVFSLISSINAKTSYGSKTRAFGFLCLYFGDSCSGSQVFLTVVLMAVGIALIAFIIGCTMGACIEMCCCYCVDRRSYTERKEMV